MSDKTVIALVGKIASGKSQATKYLKEKYQLESFKFSDCLRDILQRLYLENQRDNIQKLSEGLRKFLGEDIIAKTITNDIKNKARSAVVIADGARRPADLVFLKDFSKFILISIESDQKTRYQRITQRQENSDDQNLTFEKFQEQELNESEKYIEELSSQANIKIDNNGDITNLHQQLDKVIKDIKN